jgi:hypothetical protein
MPPATRDDGAHDEERRVAPAMMAHPSVRALPPSGASAAGSTRNGARSRDGIDGTRTGPSY